MPLRRLLLLLVVSALALGASAAVGAGAPERATATGVRIPSVVGLRLDLATKRLQRAGLRVNEECDGAFGCWIKRNWQACLQHPPAGRRVARYSVVMVYAARPGDC